MAKKCKGKTEDGKRCKYNASIGDYCKIHHPDRIDEVPEKKEEPKKEELHRVAKVNSLNLLTEVMRKYHSKKGLLDSNHDKTKYVAIKYLCEKMKATVKFDNGNDDIVAELK